MGGQAGASSLQPRACLRTLTSTTTLPLHPSGHSGRQTCTQPHQQRKALSAAARPPGAFIPLGVRKAKARAGAWVPGIVVGLPVQEITMLAAASLPEQLTCTNCCPQSPCRLFADQPVLAAVHLGRLRQAAAPHPVRNRTQDGHRCMLLEALPAACCLLCRSAAAAAAAAAAAPASARTSSC